MDVKEAVERSLKSYKEVFPESLQQDLRLETVKLSDNENNWVTTLSVLNPERAEAPLSEPPASSFAALFFANTPRRLFKTIRIRTSDGQLLGIGDAD